MVRPREPQGEWILQEFAIVAGKPWFALQFQTDSGVEIQYTGYRTEMDELVVKFGIEPEELPVITENEFFLRCEK